MTITSLALSNNGNFFQTIILIFLIGKLIASGQQGTLYSQYPDSPIILWDL